MFRNWPTEITGNMFDLVKLDPAKPLAFKVTTWSNIFAYGGNVTIDGYDENNTRHGLHFASITVDRDASVLDEREHLQGLVDFFNDDLANNWRSLIESARDKVAAYYEKQANEYREKSDAAKRGDWSAI